MIRRIYNAYLWHRSEYFTLSFPKSGKTWIKNTLADYYSHYYATHGQITFSPLVRIGKKRQVPRIIFTHAMPRSASFKQTREMMENLAKKSVILHVRDPRNVALTYYFQVIKRANIAEAAELSFPEFLRHPVMGIDRIIRFMNAGYGLRHTYKKFMLTRYEDYLANTQPEIERTLNFLDTPIDSKILAGSLKNISDTTRLIENEQLPGLGPQLNSYTEDSAVEQKWDLPSYMNYIGNSDIKYLDKCMKQLNPDFGYS
ncbi:sulfotransferase domain-containing protein [Thiogranum longum]|uniref:Sulfotransferase domain-containing protein n=1 Tax=Thiogranum longum TaxID=1537524 RepID=A0A4R1HIZ5_9GAMM|nr:sulfotransferase domain-containing protein [Thiogranum longum]TCK19459.1 sulfotransferase domain-containing protein [Thiogranum longum]